MSIKSAVAYSRIDDSFAAGKSAIQAVMKKLDQCPDFLLVFTTIGHDIQKVIKGIQSIAEIPLCGCSGAGIITHLGCDEGTHSVGIMGLKSKQIDFYPFIISNLAASPDKVGKQIGEKIQSFGISESDKKLLFLFPDGLTLNADKLFKAIESVVGHIDFAGGTAGNDFHFTKTYQFCNQQILTDAVSGVLISGNFDYEIGVSHGCKPMGNYKTVTKAQANIIYEIDHQPALELLKSLIGANRFSDFLQVNFIGLGQSFEGKGYSQNLIARAILGFDEQQESIQVGVEIPVGSVIRFTRRDKVKVLQQTQNMAEKVIANIKSPYGAAYFYFNCVGRGSYLFDESDTDVNLIQEVLGDDKNLIGFFAFGEIAPVMGENYFHNNSGVLVGLE